MKTILSRMERLTNAIESRLGENSVITKELKLIYSDLKLYNAHHQISESAPLFSKKLPIDYLLQICAEVFEVTEEQIKENNRKKHVAIARHTFVYLVKTQLNLSYWAIADYLGKKSHASMKHCKSVIEYLLTHENEHFDKIIEAMECVTSQLKEKDLK